MCQNGSNGNTLYQKPDKNRSRLHAWPRSTAAWYLDDLRVYFLSGFRSRLLCSEPPDFVSFLSDFLLSFSRSDFDLPGPAIGCLLKARARLKCALEMTRGNGLSVTRFYHHAHSCMYNSLPSSLILIPPGKHEGNCRRESSGGHGHRTPFVSVRSSGCPYGRHLRDRAAAGFLPARRNHCRCRRGPNP